MILNNAKKTLIFVFKNSKTIHAKSVHVKRNNIHVRNVFVKKNKRRVKNAGNWRTAKNAAKRAVLTEGMNVLAVENTKKQL